MKRKIPGNKIASTVTATILALAVTIIAAPTVSAQEAQEVCVTDLTASPVVIAPHPEITGGLHMHWVDCALQQPPDPNPSCGIDILVGLNGAYIGVIAACPPS